MTACVFRLILCALFPAGFSFGLSYCSTELACVFRSLFPQRFRFKRCLRYTLNLYIFALQPSAWAALDNYGIEARMESIGQFSSVHDSMDALGKAHMRSTPSLRSFLNVAFETVQKGLVVPVISSFGSWYSTSELICPSVWPENK